MSEKRKAREIAYRVWVECGQNFSETERRLGRADIGLPVSRQSLMGWAERYDWKGRAARMEAERQKQETAMAEDGLVAALGKQKARYEKYFDTMADGLVDNQACYAFCGLVKTMISVKRTSRGDGSSSGDNEDAEEKKGEDREKELQAYVAPRVFADEEERIRVLEETVDLWIGRVLADPAKVNAGVWRDIRAALALIDQLKAKSGAGEGIVEISAPVEEGATVDSPEIVIVGPEDAKAALWEVFSRMIGAMLAHPEKIKVGEIERAMGYLEKMREREEKEVSRGDRSSSGDNEIAEETQRNEPVEKEQKPEIDDVEEAEVLFDVGIWGETEAIEALQGFVAKQLRMMQAGRGEAKAGQVKAVKDAMELIETLKARSAKQEAGSGKKKRGLSNETAEEFRKKLLRGEAG